MDNPASNFQSLIDNITPEIHRNLKRAVELGKWDSGERLTRQQVELCLQAIIAYEHRTIGESERTGYIDRSGSKKSRN